MEMKPAFPQKALGLTSAYGGASWRIREGPGSRLCFVHSPHCFSDVQVKDESMTDTITLGSHLLLPGKPPNYLRLILLSQHHRFKSIECNPKRACTTASLVWDIMQKGTQVLMGGKTEQLIILITWNSQQVLYETLHPWLSFLKSKYPSLSSLI
jgi:hypothetical protein